jgi:hypothetical protein
MEKRVDLEKLCNFVFYNFFIWSCYNVSLFDSKDFIEVNTKESISSILISECVVVVKGEGTCDAKEGGELGNLKIYSKLWPLIQL